MPGDVDSNSPALWDRLDGQELFFVMTSVAGSPSIASGTQLETLTASAPVTVTWPGGGVWMEAVIADVDGTWYGYYHNEIVAEACGTSEKVFPRIGSARSRDRGRTWESLGVLLEAPPDTHDCSSTNHYFVGGIGDLSAVLDADSRYVYFFVSTYHQATHLQGVSVARLAWADRDVPEGNVAAWQDGIWRHAERGAPDGGGPRWSYPAPVPMLPAAGSWHDEPVDAFWGPAVHWNTYLEQYVMLLNRAADGHFRQEGIYVSFAPVLDDPWQWSTPVKLLAGGRWYPQVIGLEPGTGGDKVAGSWARFFMSGASEHLIRFIK